MVNLVVSNRRRRFYLWLDPRLPSVRQQVGLFGRVEAGETDTGAAGVDQPAQRRVQRAEVVLENFRAAHLAGYPSRHYGALVFDRLEDAWLYHDMHREALAGHILKATEARGLFAVSLHDSLWADLLATYDSDPVDDYVARAYWMGETTSGRIPEGVIFNRLRRPERIPALEGIFYGTLRFPDQQLERHDLPRPAAVRARLAAWGVGDWTLTREPGEESETIALDPEEAGPLDAPAPDFDHSASHPDPVARHDLDTKDPA